jgi:hypothetical protein
MNKLAFIHIPKNAGTSIKKICCECNVEYHYHNIDPDTINIPYFLVLRDPISRFCSAVSYVMHDKWWQKNTNVSILITKEINNCEKFVQHMQNDKKLVWSVLAGEKISNGRAGCSIGGKEQELAFVFCKQGLWVKNPKYVLLYDNLEIEINYLFKTILNQNIKLPHFNRSFIKNNQLSNSSIRYLENFYEEDIALYNQYKQTPLATRIK